MINQYVLNEIQRWTQNYMRFIYITVQTKQAQPSDKYVIILQHPFTKRWNYIGFCRTLYEKADVIDTITAITTLSNRYKLSPKARKFIGLEK